MKYAWVNTNLLDLWGEPQYESERVSQLLFGEVVRVVKSQAGFFKILQVDDYTGWIDERFLKPITGQQYKDWLKGVNAVIKNSTAKVYAPGNKSIPPYFLYYGTRLKVKKTKNAMFKWVLPDGSVMYIKSHAINPINNRIVEKVKGSDLVREARKFLGVPYLWGGISPAGFDCSGFFKTIFARYGLDLPRDTKDQIKAGRKVERDRMIAGDLIFFKRHVGLVVSPDRFIHSSLSGGGVRINSLLPGEPDYRADLDKNFNQVRRIL